MRPACQIFFLLRRLRRRKSLLAASSGFSLLETLAALAFISVSLFGLWRMQLDALRHLRFAWFDQQALIFCVSMREQLRANSSAHYQTSFASVTSEPSRRCHNSSCAPQALADYQIQRWLYRLSRALPEAEGRIGSDEIEMRYRIIASDAWRSQKILR